MKFSLFLDSESNTSTKNSLFTPIILLFIGLCLFIADYKVNDFLGHYNIKLSIAYCILTIPLIFKKYWPKMLLKAFPVIWHASLIFFLPFFFTYGYFQNPESNLWSLAMLGSYIGLTMLVKNKLLWPSLFVGAFLGLMISDPETKGYPFPENFGYVITSSFAIVIYCSYLLSQFEANHKERLAIVEKLGASIAHELRTPIAAVSLAGYGIGENLTKLIDAYHLAQKNNLPVAPIDKLALESLKSSPETLQNTCAVAQNTIDMLLLNLRNPQQIGMNPVSAANCIQETLAEYPLQAHEKEFVQVKIETDFNFIGNQSMMKHIMFNLLKNSLYYLRTWQNKKILITVYRKKEEGYITFRDSGPGIENEHLPYIFDKFYTMRDEGTGLGLSFCKHIIKSFKGNISCSSTKGEFTEFQIILPITTKAIEAEKAH